MKHLTARVRFVSVLLIAALAGPALAQGGGMRRDPRHPHINLWYALAMSGQRVGHAHITVQRQGDHIVTTNQTKLIIKRGPMTVPIQQHSTWIETLDGQPIKATSEMKSSVMGATDQTLRFDDDGGMTLTTGSEAGAGTRTQHLPAIQGDWMTPYQAQLYQARQVDQGAKSFKVRTVDLSLGPKAHTMTFTRQGQEDVQALGKTVPAAKYQAVVDAMPGNPMTQYIDDQGNVVKQSVAAMPGMDVTMLLADKATAMAKVNPPELVAKTLIHPDKPIDNPRNLTAATYKIHVSGEGKFTIPQSGAQHVVYGTGRTAKVIVDPDNPVAPGSDTPTAAERDASTMIDSEDPKIQALTKQATADLPAGASDTDKAHAIRSFVHDYMTQKDLSVGFATASEAARTRQGDCTEHAVLLAAMLRAGGIPARTASGLMYVQQFVGQRGVFGYHMWAQAWLDGHWSGLDAILPAGHAFDATHILLGTSPMTDAGYNNDMVKLMPLLGTLKINVVHAQ